MVLKFQLIIWQDSDQWACSQRRSHSLDVAYQAGGGEDLIDYLVPHRGLGDLLQVADVHAPSQTEVVISICLLDEPTIELEQSIEVPQVDGTLIRAGCCPACLFSQNALHRLAEFQQGSDIQAREQTIVEDLALQYAPVVVLGQLLQVDLVEPIQEGFGQRLAATNR